MMKEDSSGIECSERLYKRLVKSQFFVYNGYEELPTQKGAES